MTHLQQYIGGAILGMRVVLLGMVIAMARGGRYLFFQYIVPIKIVKQD